MKEHDELMKALEAWHETVQFDDASAEITDAVLNAYRAYRNAPKPLVLEQVDWEDVEEWDKVYQKEEGTSALVETLKVNRHQKPPHFNGQCYALSETE